MADQELEAGTGGVGMPSNGELPPAVAEKLQIVQESWDQLNEGHSREKTLNALYRQALVLEDAAKSAGLQAMGAAAAQFTCFLDFLVQYSKEFSQDKSDQGTLLLENVKQCALSLDEEQMVYHEETAQLVAEEISPVVYLLDTDRNALATLEEQLRYFGYNARAFSSEEDLEAAEWPSTPIVLVLGVDLPGEELGGLRLAKEKASRPGVHIVFLSVKNDLATRLETVRAGGIAFLIKPVDVTELVEAIENLTRREPMEPYRVLIVDDSQAMSHYYASLLERESFLVYALNNSLQTLEILDEFQPDAILVDIDVSPCGGIDLARVIRQEFRWAGVSIALLTPTGMADDIMEFHKVTREDVLVRPMLPDDLIGLMRDLVRRSRLIRALSVRDGLTGLFNRVSLKENLGREVRRCKRYNAPLSFAMADIDALGAINQNYGHQIGDQVLRSFARLIRRRLRTSDVLGRYGGGTFGIVLPDAGIEAARGVLESIRADFSAMPHTAFGGDFRVTFSAGVAAFPGFPDPPTLLEGAEKALAQAKKSGRNCVETVAPPPSKEEEGKGGASPTKETRGIRLFGGDAAEEGDAGAVVDQANCRARIVLAEDDRSLSKLVRFRLESANFAVFDFNNGESALQWVEAHQPDLVITDLLLPRMHGFEVCRRIKGSPNLKAIPVILMTGVYTNLKFEYEGKNLGADAFVRKPVDFPALIAKIEELLRL